MPLHRKVDLALSMRPEASAEAMRMVLVACARGRRECYRCLHETEAVAHAKHRLEGRGDSRGTRHEACGEVVPVHHLGELRLRHDTTVEHPVEKPGDITGACGNVTHRPPVEAAVVIQIKEHVFGEWWGHHGPGDGVGGRDRWTRRHVQEDARSVGHVGPLRHIERQGVRIGVGTTLCRRCKGGVGWNQVSCHPHVLCPVG
mmetsp:Transcript_10614/g.27297  ORF Transcript_10614/g.27297 Transcript_10614/m.27297 type:complete len:201 (+) Transcript_10614:365-967(+)